VDNETRDLLSRALLYLELYSQNPMQNYYEESRVLLKNIQAKIAELEHPKRQTLSKSVARLFNIYTNY